MDLVQKISKLMNDKTHGAKTGKSKIAEFNSGDTVGVYVRVKEGEKERVQLYQGVVIRIQGKGETRNFTVRKMSSGVGVERTFPFKSPNLDRVEVVSTGKVRRSKLYYLRKLRGKAASIESELVATEKQEEVVVDPNAAPRVPSAKNAAKKEAKKAAKKAASKPKA